MLITEVLITNVSGNLVSCNKKVPNFSKEKFNITLEKGNFINVYINNGNVTDVELYQKQINKQKKKNSR